MEFYERLAASLLFRHRMQEQYHESAFEEFFHKLMEYSDPEFLAVRTAGSLGDMGADGLTLVARKIYACYGPQVYDAGQVKRKFDGDLAKAIHKRRGSFDTFVFVHNGTRGLHPVITQEMAGARKVHPSISFEPLGPIHLQRALLKLDRCEIEDVLGSQLPVDVMQFRVGIEDLSPLLEHLARTKIPAGVARIPKVSSLKMEFNQIDSETQALLRTALRSTYQVEQYYEERREILERDQVAYGLTQEYRRIAEESQDPDEVLWHLEQYVAGNASIPFEVRRAAMVVLAHFFETCDIFEEPTREWLEGRGA